MAGRQRNLGIHYNRIHPVILYTKHVIARTVIRTQHVHLLHTGPLLVADSLSRRYHLIGEWKEIYSLTRGCIICWRKSARTQPPQMHQLPLQHSTPDSVLKRVGVDYAGLMYVKHGYVRKLVVIKVYMWPRMRKGTICRNSQFSLFYTHRKLRLWRLQWYL